MTLKIIRAFADSDFRSELLARIHKKYQADPQARFFYVVPNHIKFSSEVGVLKDFGGLLGAKTQDNQAFSRLQVYSFSRLAWALTKQEEGKTALTDLSIAILVGQVLRDLPLAQLGIFARSARLPGFVANVAAQLQEIWDSGLTAAELGATHSGQDRLADKIHFLAIIEAQVLPLLADFELPADKLQNFAEDLADLDLSHANFYFEGFSNFTNTEMSVLQAIIALDRQGRLGSDSEVTVALIGDSASDRFGDGNLFFKTNRLIRENFPDAQIERIHRDRNLSMSQQNFEKSWRELETQGFAQEKRPLPQMSIRAVSSQENEAAFVARSIRRKLVDDPTLRARDILVIAQRLDNYKDILPHFFQRYDLPYFLDSDTRMSDHPLASVLESLLTPSAEFDYERVMRILKSGLFQWESETNFQDSLDYLENFVLAANPKEALWRNGDFQYVAISDEQDVAKSDPQDQRINQMVNQMRVYIVQLLDSFKDRFAKVTTYGQAVRTLMTWLLDFKVDQVFIAQANRGDDRGVQAWKMLINSLEQIDHLIADKEFVGQDFLQMLKDGFAAATFSGIPASLDQITISESGIVQRQDYRLLYFIGATSDSLPAQIDSKSLLDDSDRQQLVSDFAEAKKDYFLQDTSRQQMAAENLRFYSTVLSATESVVFSYPKFRSDGKKNELSPYLSRLSLPEVSDLHEVKVPDLPEKKADLVNYLGNANSSVTAVSRSAKAYGTAFIDGLYSLIALRNANFKKVLAASHYENQVVTLRKDLVDKLFGKDLRLSISQIERYFSNPYEYFLQYGLRLKKRSQFTLDPALSGSYYHAIFEKVVDRMIEKKVAFRDLSNQELDESSRQAAESLLQQEDFQILDSDDHFQAVAKSLTQDVALTFRLMRLSNAFNQSRPIRTEAAFGRLDQDNKQAPLIGLDFTLENGNRLYLRGKVDRIDSQDQNHDFATIIDYKSNGKQFNFRDAYVGSELQLLTYWMDLLKNTQQLGSRQLGGAVFAQIKNQPATIADMLSKGVPLDQVFGQNAQFQRPDFQFRGLLLDDSAYLDNLQHLEAGEKADFYHFSLTKNEQHAVSDDVLSKEDLQLLMKHDQDKLVQAGNAISQGRFPLYPLREGDQRSALTYSDYKEVMNFDRSFGDRYHDLNVYPNNRKGILALLKKEQEK